MNARVCVCCGQPLTDKAAVFSRNPNICPSCSSLLDGLDDPKEVEEVQTPKPDKPDAVRKAA